MQLIYIIAIPLAVLIFFIVLSLKTDWKEIDRHNRQYYVAATIFIMTVKFYGKSSQ